MNCQCCALFIKFTITNRLLLRNTKRTGIEWLHFPLVLTFVICFYVLPRIGAHLSLLSTQCNAIHCSSKFGFCSGQTYFINFFVFVQFKHKGTITVPQLLKLIFQRLSQLILIFMPNVLTWLWSYVLSCYAFMAECSDANIIKYYKFLVANNIHV